MALESTERLRADRALDNVDSASDRRRLDWPSVASRIRDARAQAGFNESEIARRMGISVDSYCDLENYDDEAFTVTTLRNLVALGRLVDVEPKSLLLGADGDHVEQTVTFRDIAQQLARKRAENGLTVEQMGEGIGFDLEALLASPEFLWDYSVEALYVICKSLGLDWVAALPDLAATPGDSTGTGLG